MTEIKSVLSKLKLSLLAVLVLLFILFWNVPYLLPLKLFVVLIHEMSHALGALAFGGEVEGIILSLDESGVTKAKATMEQGFIVMVSAGYMGSTFIGGLLLNRGLKGKWVKPLLFILGMGIIIIAYNFILPSMDNWSMSEPAFLTAIFSFCWGIFFLMSVSFGKSFGRSVLVIVGSLSSVYCLYDFGDFIRGVETTDAGILAAYLLRRPMPEVGAKTLEDPVIMLSYMIAFLWVIFTLIVLHLFLRNALKERKKVTAKNTEADNTMNDNYSDSQFPEEQSSDSFGQRFLDERDIPGPGSY